jgi:hypothetical protein
MPVVALLLAEMGVNVALVSGLILVARIALFAHHFIKRGL